MTLIDLLNNKTFEKALDEAFIEFNKTQITTEYEQCIFVAAFLRGYVAHANLLKIKSNDFSVEKIGNNFEVKQIIQQEIQNDGYGC